jgi:hypothetical protein
MPTTTLGSLLVLAVAACSSRHDDPHWSTRPIVQAEAKSVLGNVPFTIRVPEGYGTLEGQSTFSYARKDGVEQYLSVKILDGDKHTAADELHRLGANVEPFAQRELPDGWVFAVHNPNFPKDEDYLVYSAKFMGDRELECVARASRLHDEDVKALVPKIEDICLSAAPKSP